MRKIAWVTDSTTYMTQALKEHPDVYVVPLSVIFGEEIYEDGITITQEEIYEQMRSGKAATTSQPPVGVFAALFENLKAQYEEVVLLHVSDKLSGTLSSSVQAADMTGITYHVIDSKVLTMGITFLLEEGLHLQQQGKSIEEIIARLHAIIPTLENYILIGNLQQLHRGGRLTNAQFVLGTLLNIKPILQIKEGIIQVYEKVRSEKKAVKLVMEQCKAAITAHDVRKLAIIHGNRPEDAIAWKEELLRVKPDLRVEIVPLTSVLSVHAGEGTIAAMWYNTALEG
ncbi:DegV family protein [Ectobacillus antri]|jgi:DegV family protein with EDD domain|uniref:DegV family protein n=1 Tax=Ectobacillus antri TaxID=2486280 RepID=A0ABT6H4W3_9BACI|nr:DegV family protein [Ectobacillus antri]MDG4656774.1 DegV family protein [Ectobacillus antri]MDG5753863.1 DegV family protein [Ectobacillus antri]